MKKVLTSVCVIALFLFGLGKSSTNPTDSRFGKTVTEFKITAPASYKTQNQMSSFFKKYSDTFDVFDGEDLMNASYQNVSAKLVPGKTYTVRIFPIMKDGVTPAECVNWLKSQNALLTGAQGLSLFFELKKGSFPQSKFVYSLDEKNKLPKYMDSPFIPRIRFMPLANEWSFTMGAYDDLFTLNSSQFYLLAFFE